MPETARNLQAFLHFFAQISIRIASAFLCATGKKPDPNLSPASACASDFRK